MHRENTGIQSALPRKAKYYAFSPFQMWDLSTALELANKEKEDDEDAVGGPSALELMEQLDVADLTNSCTTTPSISPSPSLLATNSTPQSLRRGVPGPGTSPSPGSLLSGNNASTPQTPGRTSTPQVAGRGSTAQTSGRGTTQQASGRGPMPHGSLGSRTTPGGASAATNMATPERLPKTKF